MTTTGPKKLLAGVKVTVPSALTPTVPCAGFARLAPVTPSGSPSRSVSLASTAMVTGALIGVAAVSLPGAGASLTGVTASISVDVRVTVPSLNVYVIGGTAPL